jgi:hypothetical protein
MHAREDDEGKHLWREAFHSCTQRLLKGWDMSKGLAERPAWLFKDLVVRHASLMLLSCRHAWGRILRSSSDRILRKSVDLCGPSEQTRILWRVFLPMRKIVQGMDPPPLMQPVMAGVACVNITAQDACNVWSDPLLHDLSRA